jgi:membrane protease subunit HflK
VEVTAPLYVKDFFDLVISAEQDRSGQINEARGEFDRITREAEGEVQRVLSSAMVRSNVLVQTAFADASAFQEQLPFYQQNPDLYRHRLAVQTLQRVMTNAQDKFYQPSGIDELRITLSREPVVPPRPQQN